MNSDCPVYTGQSGACAKIRLSKVVVLEFLGGRGAAPGAGWPHCQGAHRTVRCTPDSPVPLRQQTQFLFLRFFQTVFVLTCECVIEWHLVIVLSVNVRNCWIITNANELLMSSIWSSIHATSKLLSAMLWPFCICLWAVFHKEKSNLCLLHYLSVSHKCV